MYSSGVEVLPRIMSPKARLLLGTVFSDRFWEEEIETVSGFCRHAPCGESWSTFFRPAGWSEGCMTDDGACQEYVKREACSCFLDFWFFTGGGAWLADCEILVSRPDVEGG